VAAGVAKAHADVILISGYDGGTGASPISSIRHAGVPWELGLSETPAGPGHERPAQRVRLQVDGKLQTGRDVRSRRCWRGGVWICHDAAHRHGCIMMRKCHLNTCRWAWRRRTRNFARNFRGSPKHVINFLFYVAEDLRRVMAELGFRKLDEMIGRVDCLAQRQDVEHWKAKGIDLSSVLYNPPMPSHVGRRCTQAQDHGLDDALDGKLIEQASEAIENLTPVSLSLPIRNVHRTIGAMLSGENRAAPWLRGLAG